MSDLLKVAERYRDLLEIGDQIGVVPQVEVWGSSRTLSRLGEAALVAMEAKHPNACILPDVYHLHRGGSGLGGVKLLSPSAIHVFHFNDYPADPPREKLTDADRVYPGDGSAPLKALLKDLSAGGFRVMLSLELFNRKYWAAGSAHGRSHGPREDESPGPGLPSAMKPGRSESKTGGSAREPPVDRSSRGFDAGMSSLGFLCLWARTSRLGLLMMRRGHLDDLHFGRDARRSA